MTDELVRASNALTAKWARRESWGGAGGALSGAGAWPLLALLAAAAREPGRGELQEAVGVDAADADRHARALLEILARSTAVEGALGVWARAGLPLEPWWLDAVPGGARGELSGDPAADQARLDAWVARNTGGRLTRMPVSVPPDTQLVLATALTIETRWLEPFSDIPFRPQRGPWSGRDREAAGLARQTEDLDQLVLARTPAGPVTLLTVQGGNDVDVHLCLGEAARPAGEVLAAAVEAVGGLHPVLRGTLLARPDADPAPGVTLHKIAAFDAQPTLSVTTARFDVTAEHDLMARAELFGLATVSTHDPAGHFPGISREPLALGQAAQDVTATFSAEGFTAAAVTAMTVLATGAPLNEAYMLHAAFDRPFGFLARHRPSGLVLLAGWVAEPQDWPEGVPTSPW
ncbi:serpin family protein [Actinomadura rugatobispora]|uniref:Serpin family protein n=1 Tax=Actinomadura rugatobispora TaxID=1994 RepID=A0ABW0ZTA6_9ACTN|nr:hypothetical protein GCM10010200_110130 [Actinomadura rugatobispora]